jgi:UDP-N-acetylmuramoyl-L-alanyl-D-glutamate--2,6-diaminopimelate ligase
MELRLLLEEIPEARVDGAQDVELGHIHCDSRQVGKGDLFVAVRGGQERDRHLFVGDAVARGAGAVVVEEDVDCGGATRVRVADARQALAKLATRFYGFPGRRLLNVGITGTNGKTTTAFLVRSVLEAAGLPSGYLGTLGCSIDGELEKVGNTTPEAAELQRLLRVMVDAGLEASVLEVSSHGLALKRVVGIPFRAAVFTNLTRDHLDFHGTWEDYFEAKAQLFEDLEGEGVAVINADDPMATALAERTKVPITTYGCGHAAQVRLQQADPGPLGMRLRLVTPAGPLEVLTHLKGNFNCYNVMAALATGLALGLDPEAACRGIAALPNVPGRFERIVEGQDFEVIVDYAHTPDALDRVLRAARELGVKRLVCVFGCGGDRDRGKRPLMGKVAGELADLTVLTSDNPRSEDPQSIIDDIAAGLPQDSACRSETDRHEAITTALTAARTGDIVVIAGKGHESEQELADRVIPFDDRELARRALRRLATGEDRP